MRMTATPRISLPKKTETPPKKKKSLKKTPTQQMTTFQSQTHHPRATPSTILRFTRPFPGLHWSIYLHPPGDTIGKSHDVWYHPDSRTWERKTLFVEYVRDDTLIWDNRMTAERYLGWTEIGDVEDVEEFERVMEERSVPEGVDEDQNCQAWVRNVIVNAWWRGLLARMRLLS
ncbi:hypothetical protein DL98DRAFT_596493 [Cadophora sp. DSE1049]|nr:hypothetical protein DL98DRAFT_596493 [Cadophora sp. DSE1049]